MDKFVVTMYTPTLYVHTDIHTHTYEGIYTYTPIAVSTLG